MKNTKKILASGMIMSAVLFGSIPVFAADQAALNGNAKITASVSDIITKGDAAVAKRIATLNKATTEITNMKSITDSQKTAPLATITTTIADMNTAKAKLDADTDFKQARLDYAAIFKDNRVDMVVMPQVMVTADADRALSSSTKDQASLTKIQTRITKAQAAGKDVSKIQTQYSDAQAKLADATTQSTAMVTAANGLTVDNGDKTIIASNKTARTAIKTAKQALVSDLTTLHKDVISMSQELGALKF